MVKARKGKKLVAGLLLCTSQPAKPETMLMLTTSGRCSRTGNVVRPETTGSTSHSQKTMKAFIPNTVPRHVGMPLVFDSDGRFGTTRL